MKSSSSMRARITVWAVAAAVTLAAVHIAFPAPWGAIDMDTSGHGNVFWFGFLVIAGWDLFRHHRNPKRKQAAAPTVPVQAPSGEPTVRVEAPA